jgi:hypothetical protein
MKIYRTGGEATLPSDVLAKGLGLFSVGLGAAGLMRPRGLARFGGVADGPVERALLRAVGLREIGQGLGILTQPQPTGWVWSRVAGDVMDVSFVGFELASGRARRRGRGMVTLASLLGITAVDLFCAMRLSSRVAGPTSGGGTAREQGKAVVTIGRPREEVERAWRERGVAGQPRFRDATGGRGTVMELAEGGGQAMDELRRFKQLVEAGEAIVSDATVNGNSLAQRPARPPDGAPRRSSTHVGAGT